MLCQQLSFMRPHASLNKSSNRWFLGKKWFIRPQHDFLVAQELRDLDPNGFRALIEPIKSTDSAACSPLDLARDYLFNTIVTALLCLLSTTAKFQVGVLHSQYVSVFCNFCDWII